MKTSVNEPIHEYEFEASYGLPEELPADEKLLWQGRPDWRTLARSAMHVRLVAVYFAVMLLWRAAAAVMDGGGLVGGLMSIRLLLPLALLALGMLCLLAWLVSRTAVYTITDKRVVMRVGIVLTVTFNLPYRMIESAGLHRNLDGTGDIALTLEPTNRIAYMHLWPHARPWQIKRTQPMLRAIPDSLRVSELLVNAICQVPVPGLPVVRGVAERPVVRPASGTPTGSSGPIAA